MLKLRPFVAALALVTFVPMAALPAPMAAARAWRSGSRVATVARSAGGVGIGGLQMEIASTRLALSPSDLRYDGDALIVTRGQREERIELNPYVLLEALDIVSTSDQVVFQTSVDSTAGENSQYVDAILEDTTIGVLIGVADLEWASVIQSGVQIPEGAPTHPYERISALLESDAEYRALAQRWESPPLSWPQIYIRFSLDRRAVGGVELEFRPQVLFRNDVGHAVEPSDAEAEVALRPYQDWVRDAAAHPERYLDVLPSVRETARVTAAMGYLSVACTSATSCGHLAEQAVEAMRAGFAAKSGVEVATVSAEQAAEAYIRGQLARIEAWQLAYAQGTGNPREQTAMYSAWGLASVRDPGDGHGDDAIAAAFDNVYALATGRLESMSDELEASLLLFANGTIAAGDDALLLAARAFAESITGRGTDAAASFRRAEEAAAGYPVDQVRVGRLGAATALLITEGGLRDVGSDTLLRATRLIETGASEGHTQFDTFLTGCVARRASCTVNDVLEWEAAAMSAGVADRDGAGWAFGRASYLVGYYDSEVRADRLRVLRSYANQVGEHQTQLQRYVSELETMLVAH